MATRKIIFGKPNYIYPQPEPETEFEFDESDIHNLGDGHEMPTLKKSIRLRRKPAKIGEERVTKTGSVPVNIPDWSKILKSEYKSHDHYEYDEESDEESKVGSGGGRRIVPPHEYLAKRRGASFSVHEGIGGTLKGRDLRRVRNAIWEKLGFQD